MRCYRYQKTRMTYKLYDHGTHHASMIAGMSNLPKASWLRHNLNHGTQTGHTCFRIQNHRHSCCFMASATMNSHAPLQCINNCNSTRVLPLLVLPDNVTLKTLSPARLDLGASSVLINLTVPTMNYTRVAAMLNLSTETNYMPFVFLNWAEGLAFPVKHCWRSRVQNTRCWTSLHDSFSALA